MSGEVKVDIKSTVRRGARSGIVKLAVVALCGVLPVAAWAQSSPGLTYGQVPSAGQWNSFFASKQDVLRFTPLNQAGGTMTGRLQTAPSTINTAGFAILPGIAPTTPSNGDIWTTGAGFFARINGQTLTLSNPANVTVTGGTINGTVIGGTAPAAATFTTLAANGLSLGTPLPLAQGGCGATSALGCLTSLGISGGTAGYVLTSNGPGAVPSYQAVSAGSGSAVLYTTQSLTSGQQDQARANVAAPVTSAPSASVTLTGADIDRPLYPTGTITVTATSLSNANWRSGPILNSNATSGNITLAVPSSATLDGVTNGTTILLPKQKARIIQTGGSAYVTDWIDRSPILIASTLSAAVTQAAYNLPVGYASYEIALACQVGTAASNVGLRFSNDGGATYKAGASDYFFQYVTGTASSVAANSASSSFLPLLLNQDAQTGNWATARAVLTQGTASIKPKVDVLASSGIESNNFVTRAPMVANYATGPLVVNSLLLISPATISAGSTFTIRGMPAQ